MTFRTILGILSVASSLLVAASASAGERPQPSGPESKPRSTVRAPIASALPAIGGAWTAQGPRPIVSGQVEGITNRPVVGAVQAIVTHPTSADTIWAGAVNGGIWKTTNATNASPTWTPQTDTATSLSIATMQRDPTDGTHNTLVAGTGNRSSFGVSGPMGILLRTTNGGTNWTTLTPALLAGKSISGIAARGATIVVAVNFASSFTCGNIGIFRSTNTGTSFSMTSGAGGAGLPFGQAFDLASDPTNPSVLYTAIAYCNSGAGGIYKSTNTGATWSKVSDAAMDALLADAVFPSNVKIAVGASGQIYVAIVDDGELAGLFRSGTGGASWTQLDTPATNENGSPIGIHPAKKPGGQGSIHLSLAADPTNANVVYIGGDRQPLTPDGADFPNSIGAANYTGRLFRVNAAAGSGTQSTPLTHCTTASAACNNAASTVSNSAPHADSRWIAFDAAGNLIEGDDGGIYRRTSPLATGDWFSLNGSLQNTEMHDVAYDRISDMILSGNQDTGTSEQTSIGGTTWSQVSQGDGGDVAADDDTSTTQSTRYTSFQGLGSFRRRTVDGSGTATSTVFPALTVLGGGDDMDPQFVTPVEINRVAPTRILFGGFNDLYESFDRGDTITALGLEEPARAMVYGGRSGAVNNADLIWAISGSSVYVRTSGSGAPVITATDPGSTFLRDIAVDPADWQRAYVVNDAGQVYSTINTGSTWTNITGNLGSGTNDLYSIIVIAGSPNLIVVGGANGVFRMAANNPGVWNQFGTGLSNAIVWDLDYDAVDDTLVAGTMGRGAWKLDPAIAIGPLPALSINNVTIAEGNSGTTNAVFTVTLAPAAPWTVAVGYATSNGTAVTAGSVFTNSGSISIPDSGNASPYPSQINVAGLSGSVTKVTVTLTGFNHTYSSDVDVLLVGPGGQKVVLMSDVGGSSTASNLTLTFDDAAAGPMSDVTMTGGTFQPTNISDGLGSDTYGPPAPAGPYGSALSAFNGAAANGVWSLYVVDDVGGDQGSISGGWSLTLAAGGDYTAVAGLLTFDPGTTSRTISVPILGDVVAEGAETFFVNLSNPANATISDAQGQGTITNDDGGLASPTNVVAAATTTTNVNISWTAAAGATTYRVYRSAGGGSYTMVGETAGTSLNDATAVASTAYLYKVRSVSGSESPDSNLDLATTVIFTDSNLVGTPVKLAHFTQLLTAVNAVRTLAAQSAIGFTAPAPATNVTVRRQHVIDLRNGLDAGRAALGLAAIAYTDTTLTATTTPIKRLHIVDLRNGVQ